MKHLFMILFAVIGLTAFGQTKTAKEYYEASREAQKNEDWNMALTNIQKAILLDGTQIEYYHWKGYYQEKLEEFSDAFKTYCEAIQLFPKEPRGYMDRAIVLVNVMEYELASDDYEVALGLATKDTVKYDILLSRSAMKSAQRNFSGAYDDLLQVYHWDSTNVGALINLGAVVDELGRPEDSRKYLLKAIEQDSTCGFAYINLGYSYQNSGDHQKAIHFFNKSLELVPNDPYGLNNRSYSKLQLGDTEGAMQDVNASLSEYPDNAYAYRNRALIYLKMGKKGKACSDLDEALEKKFTELYGDEVQKLQKEHCGK